MTKARGGEAVLVARMNPGVWISYVFGLVLAVYLVGGCIKTVVRNKHFCDSDNGEVILEELFPSRRAATRAIEATCEFLNASLGYLARWQDGRASWSWSHRGGKRRTGYCHQHLDDSISASLDP
jgi:hypothetical protein